MIPAMKILLFVFFVSGAYAQSYYPVEFLNSKHDLKSAELKSMLYQIVSKNHKTTEYKEARKYLFGQLHLITNGKRLYKRLTPAEAAGKTFTIFDVYLGRELTKADFQVGKGPTPFLINEDGTTPEQEKPDPEHTIINTEHTWPKSRFSTKHSHATQEGDLHHLFPTDARLNAIRSSHRFGLIENPESNIGSAYLEGATYQREPSVMMDENGMAYKDHNNKYFEPAYEEHRGNIARAIFYFSVRYELNIDPAEEIFLTLWNLEDPVDEDETLRNNAIYKIQNNRNPFIDYPELVQQY